VPIIGGKPFHVNNKAPATSEQKKKWTSNKFVGRVEKIFKTLPKSIEWLSFLHHNRPISVDISVDVRKASVLNALNGAQTRPKIEPLASSAAPRLS
jgi:hypothetical protein